MKKLFYVLIILAFLITSFPLNAQWRRAYGPYMGTTYHLASGNGYVFASAGKISRSSDNGLTWEDKSNGIWEWGVTALFVSGTRVLTAVTSNGISLIYISDDNGENWTQLNSISNVACINGFAKSGTKLFLSTRSNGIFVSTDNGSTWATTITQPTNNQNFNCIATMGNYVFVGTSAGVYKSSDYGNSWSYCNNPDAVNNGFTEVASLAVHNNILFVGFTEYGGSRLYKSSDYGLNFSNVGSGSWLNWVRNLFVEGDNVYVNVDDGLYRSTNDGVNWNFIGLKGASTLSTEKSGGNLIVGCSDVGIFTSTNNGAGWINSGWESNHGITSLVSLNNIIVTNHGSEGLFLSRDNGNSFTEYYNITGRLLYRVTARGNDLFAGTEGAASGGVFKSSDLGYTWNSIGIPNIPVMSIAFKDNILFAGSFYNGVIRTTDDGASWRQVNTGLTSLNVISLAVIDTMVYAGTNSGVFVSSNNGNSWSLTQMQNGYINSLTVIGSKLFAGTDNGAYALESSGAWTQIGFAYKPVNCLKAIDSKLYAGSTTGLSVSTDLGNTWISVNDGLPATCIYDIAVNGDNAFLGTSNGLWRRPFAEITDAKEVKSSLPTEYLLSQNYPNPFNPATTISFNLPKTSQVNLVVYNILGKEVKTLVNEVKSAGSYNIHFDAGSLPSGVYFYRLTAGSFSETRKLVLMK